MLIVNGMEEENVKDIVLGLRLRGEEKERYLEVLRRAFQRQPRANNTHVNRRLLGLDPDTDGLVTHEDVLYFQGRQPEQKSGTSDTSKGETSRKMIPMEKLQGGRKSPASRKRSSGKP